MALKLIHHLNQMEILNDDFIEENQVLVQQEKIQVVF
jgi:hypothetical protein